ncbi:UNKNOWN [Stylonychia lemnae]|uniref:Uncharacterized protein n=1 Tax=Stylonychia lemnae TaxID=5949 RepID=A0A078ASB1_STYLE|nr:UNKNOWN [Stylonychia lemnae]|eukprot:CDW85069.1 UNKNOWN [Stylonychia lemnae]
MEGYRTVNLKYQNKRKDTIQFGTLFKYNDKNIEKIQQRENQDNLLFQPSKTIQMIRPLQATEIPGIVKRIFDNKQIQQKFTQLRSKQRAQSQRSPKRRDMSKIKSEPSNMNVLEYQSQQQQSLDGKKKSIKVERDIMTPLTDRPRRDTYINNDERLDKDFFRQQDIHFKQSIKEDHHMTQVLRDYDKSRQSEKEKYSSILNPISQQIINARRRSSNIFEIIKQKEKENNDKNKALKEGGNIGYDEERAQKIIQLFEDKRKEKLLSPNNCKYKTKYKNEIRHYNPNNIMDRLIVQNHGSKEYTSKLLNKMSKNIEFYLQPSKRPQTHNLSLRKKLTTESEDDNASTIFTENIQREDSNQIQLQLMSKRTRSLDNPSSSQRNIRTPSQFQQSSYQLTREMEETYKIYNSLQHTNGSTKGIFTKNIPDSQLSPMVLDIISNALNSIKLKNLRGKKQSCSAFYQYFQDKIYK